MACLKGIDFLVKVDTDGMGTYTAVAGQRGGTLNFSGDEIDCSSKDGSGWEEKAAGLRTWSIDFDALHSETDVGLNRLFDEFIAGNTVLVQFVGPADTYAGTAIITDLTIDAPHDDVATASGTLTGAGPATVTP